MEYSTDPYVNRLVKEWLKHDCLLIGSDIDDTLIPYNDWSKDICSQVVNLLLDCKTEGVILILNTAREESKLKESVSEIENLGLKVDAINKTPEYLNLPYGKSGKIYANIFLDDRGGLTLAMDQLRRAFEKVKEIRIQQKLKSEL